MKEIKGIHTENTMLDLVREQGGQITGHDTYVLSDGVTRYYKVRQTRCGIDGIMNHISVGRVPVPESQMDALMRDWNHGA